MSDAKTERLINLTLALLATKRYLTKSEIFRTVAGYEGSPETMERMFERDKDDLRSLGLEISVAEIDPYFQDEAGYRIESSTYALNLGELSSKDVAILSAAAALWQSSILSEASRSALRKLNSLGIPADFSGVSQFQFKFNERTDSLEKVLLAIEESREISFSYRKRDEFNESQRRLQPYALTLWQGYWYVAGRDCDRENIRIFKLARISGEIELSKKGALFSRPFDFSIHDVITSPKVSEHGESDSALVAIEKGRALHLRKISHLLREEAGQDICQIDYLDQGRLLREILRAGDAVTILSPEGLIHSYREKLSAFAEGVERG